MEIPSLQCALPPFRGSGEQTIGSRILRITAVVLGILLIFTSILFLTGVFRAIGTIPGWACLSAGLLLIAGGLSLQCAKKLENNLLASIAPLFEKGSEDSLESVNEEMWTRTKQIVGLGKQGAVERKAGLVSECGELRIKLVQLIQKLYALNQPGKPSTEDLQSLKNEFKGCEEAVEKLRRSFKEWGLDSNHSALRALDNYLGIARDQFSIHSL